MSLLDSLTARIEKQKALSLYRKRHALSSKKQMQVIRDNQSLTVFCSNDYLGLAEHPQLINALKEGADLYGVSGSSSQLVAGHLAVHQKAEQAFADFLNRESAILFNTGFMANQGVITALTQKGDCLFADKLVHASIIDACQLSKAKLMRFPHLDYQTLAKQLASSPQKNKLVVTDSVFSMRGNIADLTRCAELSKLHDATLMVDDAHGIGVLGEDGSGCQSEFNLSQDDVPILVCPLAKAFGVMGAVVAGPKKLIDGLIQFARSYVYSNALPGAYAHAALVSLQLVKQEKWRREKLKSNVEYFKQQAKNLELPMLPSSTPIQSIQLDDSALAVQVADSLRQAGILLSAMRPPTVPQGQASLRVTLSALHEHNQIHQLLIQIKESIDALSS